MKLRAAVIATVISTLVAWPAVAQQVNPPARLVIRADGTVRHRLHISPGFNLFLVFDAPVEFVAVGDDRLVSVYLRAEDGIVGLRASQQTGRTSLHVYSGGILAPFEVLVERGVRSADVVSVIVRGQARSQDTAPPRERPAGQETRQSRAPRSAPREEQPPQRAETPGHGPEQRTAANRATRLPIAVPSVALVQNSPEPVTEEGAFYAVEVSQGGVTAVFQVYRDPQGLVVWYQLSNVSGEPFLVYPERVLVRSDGRVHRWSRIERRPASQDPRVLPHGGVETGVIRLGPDQGTRAMEVVLPVFRLEQSYRTLPLILSARFDGVNQLPEVRIRG